MMLLKSIVGVAFVMLVAGQSAGYRAEIDAFRKTRETEIGGPNGWASLAGLHWLTAGTHTIGRAKTNAIVLDAPSSPDALGTVVVDAAGATLQIATGVRALVGGAPVTTAALRPNGAPERGVVVGGMTIALIKRGPRLALRVWDEKTPGRVSFTGLRWFAIDPTWRIDATFVPHTPAPRAKIMNVLNEIVEMPNVGYAEFVVGGQKVRLEALLESDNAPELFFMFRDGTSGHETYAAGRYLYTALPKDGHVVLDFNEAKNPPCAFTAFATCPLPPASNRLTVKIPAGELIIRIDECWVRGAS